MAKDRPRKPVGAWIAIAFLGLAELALVALSLLALPQASTAQVLDERFPFLEDRVRRNRQQRMQQLQQWNQQQWNQQFSPFGSHEQPRQAPVDSTRAPAPRRQDTTPTVNVVVFGDSMADWLAYGLEEAFAETPEVGIVRKGRANTGLIRVEIRGEAYDWPQSAREMLAAEKSDYIVMMLGTADRRGIREAIRPQAPARPPAGQKQAADQKQAPQATTPAPATAPAAKTADAEAPQETAQQQDQDQPSIVAPEAPSAGTVVREFRSEEWGELYGKRVDEMIGIMKAKGVPVFWVGLPPIRGTRSTSEMVYLNDIYRGRAEKAGIVYIDVWDGFVDEAGNYSNYGPDFEGQTRRLRAGDGVHFTRPGARKLAHYLEREIRRLMLARTTPLATPAPEPEPEAEKAPPTAAAPGLPPRPIASPVMSLTSPRGAGDVLAGGPQPRAGGADTVATRVLVRGEPIEAPAGRADDFAWPRRDIVTATGVLPPDPVEPEPKAEPAVAGAPTAPAAPQKQATRPPRERRVEQQTGWQPWGQQRQQPQQRWEAPSFFRSLFGR